MQRSSHLLLAALGVLPGLLIKASTEYCDAPLGMTTGAIADSQISVSSSYDSHHDKRSARINTFVAQTAWCAKQSTNGQYLQVNFGQLTTVTAVATQGRANSGQWVTLYRIVYSTDGRNWITHKEKGQIKEFVGNADSSSVVKNAFETPIKAVLVRINPRAWRQHVSMRAEFFGCVSGCAFPLGISHGALDGTRLTASSSVDEKHDERGARLNTFETPAKAWCAKHNNAYQHLQVDLVSKTKVTAVATQGRNGGSQRVTSYQLQYSLDGDVWRRYKVRGQVKTFSGNGDPDSVVKNSLPEPITARYVRFHPTSWNEHISMRIEVFGCPRECDYPLGLTNGAIDGSHIETSSNADAGHDGRYSRLHTVVGAGAWCTQDNNIYQWLQVNLEKAHRITAVATQGRVNTDQWVTSYQLHYSNDGYSWQPVTSTNSTEIKLFHGNSDRHSVVKNGLQTPIVAKYLRINPRSWYNHICMRAEVYGCPESSTT